ncbi:hypothetical protein EMUR_01305 [Ehrlichia muris AS145]|uniref:Uncharacterized protein n=1 Tax=Ehrlichia muris AS145 TaxID=1423892 RepID=V9R9Y4_9RICK|nr:hypothetical protein EMUR_01305 [Ehrlichia muris AS145]
MGNLFVLLLLLCIYNDPNTKRLLLAVECHTFGSEYLNSNDMLYINLHYVFCYRMNVICYMLLLLIVEI